MSKTRNSGLFQYAQIEYPAVLLFFVSASSPYSLQVNLELNKAIA